MALNDLAVRRAKPQDKPYKLFDGAGLFLEVTPAGGKHWKLKFRVANKERKLSIGPYPEISLAEARNKTSDARRQLAAGSDPAQQKQAEKRAKKLTAGNSFEMVAREFMKVRMADKAPSTIRKKTELMEKNLFPSLGLRPVNEITAPELLATIRKVEARGALEIAHRCSQTCSQVFRYAVATGLAERDPAADLRGALKPVVVKHHAAVTDPLEVGKLLRAIDGYIGTYAVRCALQLAPLVFTRPGELRKAEWTEFDLDKAEWNIPAAKMKMREPHLVPLSTQAVTILRELHKLTGTDHYVFPSVRTGKRPISDNTLNAGLRRIGYDHNEMTTHGFRAMARTILDEVLDVRPELIEHQLAHAVKDPMGRAYNRTKHLAARREMMQQWADYLDEQRKGAKVIALGQ